MNPDCERWIALLQENLSLAQELARIPLDTYLRSPEHQLAFEALVMRVGDLAKRISALEPDLTTDEVWAKAARARDFSAHHYHRIDVVALYKTVKFALPELQEAVRILSRL